MLYKYDDDIYSFYFIFLLYAYLTIIKIYISLTTWLFKLIDYESVSRINYLPKFLMSCVTENPLIISARRIFSGGEKFSMFQ